MNKIITIVGNIGAGKSSAMNLVVEALNGEPVDADDLFQTSDPFRDQYLADLPRWALTNELWLTVERAKILREAVTHQKKEWLVVDSGLLMSRVYTHSHFLNGKISQTEWDLYKELYRELTGDLYKNLYVIYLDYPIETLMQRIKQRGRNYELEYYTWDYLAQIETGLKALVDNLKENDVPVIHIGEKEIPEFVVNKVGGVQLRTLIKQMAV